MEQLISVIIPVYNSEQYISSCLDSIINQTYQNLEIIVVNDGSTDNSLKLLLEYQGKDRRIKTIDIVNHGVSHARNIGIKYSTGEYITFVDSDDTIELDTIETLYKDIIENEADLVQCNNYINSKKTYYTYDNHKLNGKTEVFQEFLKDLLCCTVWGKLYKRELFDYVSFNEEYNNHEDELFLYEIVKHCNSVFMEAKLLYKYSWNKKGSLTNKKTDKKDIEVFVQLFNDVIEYTKENHPDLIEQTNKFLTRKMYFLKELKEDISIKDFDLESINPDVRKIIIDFCENNK